MAPGGLVLAVAGLFVKKCSVIPIPETSATDPAPKCFTTPSFYSSQLKLKNWYNTDDIGEGLGEG